YAIQQVKDLGIDSMLGVNPYTENDFRSGGKFHSPSTDWDIRMGNIQPSQSLNDLASFSRQIEGWHNGAHGTIGNVLNTPEMGNPSVNQFLAMFWNLHFLINQKFEEQLLNYANAVQPQLSTAKEVIEHIEEDHHDAVNSI
ncbi:MAG: hypothetical protein ACPKPY_02310, partial [Nitrososphaeraceae archaeon]